MCHATNKKALGETLIAGNLKLWYAVGLSTVSTGIKDNFVSAVDNWVIHSGLQVIHMPLECVLRYLERTIVFRVPRVLNQVIHRVSGCYHFNSQVVDNYGAGCIA